MHMRYALVFAALTLCSAATGHAQSRASAPYRLQVGGQSSSDRFPSLVPRYTASQTTISKLVEEPHEAAGAHRSIWRGALIGGLVSAGAAALIASATCGDDDGRPKRTCSGVVVRSAVIALPVGAIIGAGIASTGRR